MAPFSNICKATLSIRIYSHTIDPHYRPVVSSSDADRHSSEKSLMLGKIEDRRRRECQRMRRLDGITKVINMSLEHLQEMVRGREAWHAAVHGVTRSQTRMGD